MKKHVVVLLAVLALLLTAVTVSAAVLIGREDDVTHRVLNQQGDVSAADGYVVHAAYKLDDHPCWYSRIPFGQPDAVENDFRFHRKRLSFNREFAGFMGVDMDNNLPMELELQSKDSEYFGKCWKEAGKPVPPVLEEYDKLAKQTPEGSVGTKVFKLSELMDYYPIFWHISFGDTINSWHTMSEWLYAYDIGEAEKMENYFRIPVLPEETCTLTVDRRENGYREGEDYREEEAQEGREQFVLQSFGDVLGNTAYFTFDPHTTEGNPVDTSQIPGGFGLYAVSLDDNNQVDYDTLTTCMPLDPAYTPWDIVADPDSGHLLYFALKDRSLWLQVLDPQEGKILQQLPLWQQEDDYQWYRVADGNIYCITSGRYLDVFRKNDDGIYSLALHAPMEDDTFCWDYLYEADFAFHGDSMAVVERYLEPDDASREIYRDRGHCGFRLTVLDESGVAYQGTYLSSLETEGRMDEFPGNWTEKAKITVE